MVGISNNNKGVPTNVVPQTPTPSVQPIAPVVNEPSTELDAKWIRWRCLVCNYIYEGAQPLKKCPRCNNEDPNKFEDVD